MSQGSEFKITFWLESPSPHQASLIRALAEQEGVTVAVVADRDSSNRRRSMGWLSGDFGKAAVFIAPPLSQRQALEESLQDSDIHIMTGVLSYPRIADTTVRLLKAGCRVLCQTERWDDRGVKGFARRLLYRRRLTYLRRFPRAGVLAMGSLGVCSVERLGFPPSRIAEFAYWVDSKARLSEESRRGALFVGELTPRKGLDYLIDAVAALPGAHLAIVGAGKDLKLYQDRIRDLDSVELLGVVNNAEIGEVMAQYRVLVLPTLYDGWGAVVNEALLVGTPVICSDVAGASCLLAPGTPERGIVVPARDSNAIKEALGTVGLENEESPFNSLLIQNWAQRSISPEAGAIYLRQLCMSRGPSGEVDFSSAVPPWRLITGSA